MIAQFNNRHPGDAEYLGAVAGLADLYGRSHAVGDWVTYRRDGWEPGRPVSGRVVRVVPGGWYVADGVGPAEFVAPDEAMPF